MIKLPEKPKVILRERNTGVFEIAGLYPGYGITIGNALRRAILSSLPGAAVTFVKLKGVGHEFSTIPGVLEDVVDLLLNIKRLRFILHSEEPQRVTVKVKGEREVSAKDIEAPAQLEVVNKDIHIATLTSKKAELEMEMQVERGLGYEPVESRKKEKLEVGVIAVDAIFTPIRKVNYEVENMRVGDRTDYNRLRIHIETDGTISPEKALKDAFAILVDQFKTIGEGIVPKEAAIKKKTKKAVSAVSPQEIDEMELSTRTKNALMRAGMKGAKDIARKSEEELRQIEGVGDKGIQEIRKALKKRGLELKG